jgi:hypothetical protein
MGSPQKAYEKRYHRAKLGLKKEFDNFRKKNNLKFRSGFYRRLQSADDPQSGSNQSQFEGVYIDSRKCKHKAMHDISSKTPKIDKRNKVRSGMGIEKQISMHSQGSKSSMSKQSSSMSNLHEKEKHLSLLFKSVGENGQSSIVVTKNHISLN